MEKINSIIKIVFILFFIFIFPKNSFAQKFELLAPGGTLTRGQTVTFTINIDTKSKKLTTAQIGLTYNTQYLEFINVTPGDTFSTVSSEPVETGKILITGEDTSGFNGKGIFAYVNFKLIAASPGSTELCALWAPQPSPTKVPTGIQPTGIQPTSLPRTGYETPQNIASFLGVFFAISAVISLSILKKIK